MDNSILDSVKKACNTDPSYTVFDGEIIMHINSALADLNQIGVGPTNGFQIVDNTATWNDFYGGDLTHNNIQSYVCLRVRLLFNPPDSGFAVTSMQAQIDKFEWRIRERREEYAWVPPTTVSPPSETILDGGVG